MSIEMMCRVNERRWRSVLERAVVMTLAEGAQFDGEFTMPDMGMVAWELGSNETDVRAVIVKLELDGVIEPTGKWLDGETPIFVLKPSLMPRKPSWSRES